MNQDTNTVGGGKQSLTPEQLESLQAYISELRKYGLTDAAYNEITEKIRQQQNINQSSVEAEKYPIGGYAPGNYTCKCLTCGEHFAGDKRATQCEPCATTPSSPVESPSCSGESLVASNGNSEPARLCHSLVLSEPMQQDCEQELFNYLHGELNCLPLYTNLDDIRKIILKHVPYATR